MFRSLRAIIAVLPLAVFTALPAYAQTTVGRGANTLLPRLSDNPWARDCLERGDCHLSQIPAFVLYVSNYLVGLSGTVALVMVMYGGYLYVLSGINEGNKGKGMKVISMALGGFAMTLFAYIIVKALEGLLL